MSALRHRTTRFVLVVLAGLAGWQAFLALSAPQRLDAALAAELERGDYVNIAVALAFPPEDFHIRIFQTHGVVSGVRGTTVLLNRVRPDDVRQISRYYWVQRIHPQTPQTPRAPQRSPS